MRYLFTLVILCFCQSIFANPDTLTQEQHFDQIYFETATSIAGRNPHRALEVSDSLYKHATSELQKVKSLMLTATLLQQEGEFNQAIIKALDADKVATKNSLTDWEARIAGFLSSRYRDLGLYKQGEVYLKKGRELGQLMQDESARRIYLGMVCQESAYYELEYGSYEKALKNINEAANFFNIIPQSINKIYFNATNEELLGRAYLGLKEPRKALLHFKTATKLMNEIGQNDATVSGLISNGIGAAFIELNGLDSAIIYLQKANEMAQTSNYLSLKVEVYKSLSKYYKLVSDFENYAIYNDKHLASLKEVEQKKKEFLNLFVSDIETRGYVLQSNQNILVISIVFLVLALIGGVFFYQRSKKRNFLRFKNILQEMKDREQNLEAPLNIAISAEENLEKKKLQISESLEIKILEDLKEFEQGDKFTDSNMSLSVLSSIIGTNTKYLSYVLNTHKGKDFSTYVNELRVKYIALKMEKDSKYRNYKISYLAEESGFSSHSKFSAVFKAVTGFSPSVFLDFLAKEQA